ncbi:MAG: hypothetical protein CL908_25020 [Deltaproteobacteria bacterium]|jgi:hypothetical protein|nr:hypothetical protein [Deltaproteobacteria bacterium]
MAESERHAIPDNLDPLVDTMSNVVGILVIVVALTQIQLGDALDRVAELDAQRGRAEQAHGARRPSAADALARQREALFRRSDESPERAAEVARAMLARIEALPSAAPEDAETLESLTVRLDSAERALAQSRLALDHRSEFAAALQRVPKKKVARLPDPAIVRGKESWMLVRYGRIYLVDTEKLYEAGSRAIEQIIAGSLTPSLRREALEDVDFYLRKKKVGFGNFRWRMRTEPSVFMEVTWRDLDVGIEPTRLDHDVALSTWLAIRSPEIDVIHFRVWSDSFEAYLAARERVEKAGFQARWTGLELDQEIGVPIRFGARSSRIIPIEVD